MAAGQINDGDVWLQFPNQTGEWEGHVSDNGRTLDYPTRGLSGKESAGDRYFWDEDEARYKCRKDYADGSYIERWIEFDVDSGGFLMGWTRYDAAGQPTSSGSSSGTYRQ